MSDETITPGDLTLAAADAALALGSPTAMPAELDSRVEEIPLLPTKPSRRSTDLMSFDSPFIMDLSQEARPTFEGENTASFDALWESFPTDTTSTSRGWSGMDVDTLMVTLSGIGKVENLSTDGAELSERQITVTGANGMALLRVRIADEREDGCLWRLKVGAEQGALKTEIMRVLQQ